MRIKIGVRDYLYFSFGDKSKDARFLCVYNLVGDYGVDNTWVVYNKGVLCRKRFGNLY